jgi:YrbI family 3-deoxy-D-manno-octulosonate 8-phosphate phosphatase
MAPESYLELDEPGDWLIAEELLKARLEAAEGAVAWTGATGGKRTARGAAIATSTGSCAADSPSTAMATATGAADGSCAAKDAREPVSARTRIKMFLTDCDGTLTDAGMYYSARGEELKKFNTRDGAGLRMLKERGIVTGIVTGENSEVVRRRAEKLGVDELLLGVGDKASAIARLCAKYGIAMDEVAFVGDDANDAEALRSVGLGICVADAAQEARACAARATAARGGCGAVREAAEFVLAMQPQP